jgi:hypothetical protein
VYDFSCIKDHKRPDDGSQLELKHATVNKFIKLVLGVTDIIHIPVIC